MSGYPQLPESIRGSIDYRLAKLSRIQKVVPTYSSNAFWIKREDELSSGTTGSKLRKYAGIIPYLLKEKIDSVGIIGGPNSNNLVGLVQCLREHHIQPIAFMREPSDKQIRGNSLLLSMLLDENERHYIPHTEWPDAFECAVKHLKNEYPEKRTTVLREGAYSIEGLLGALTLAEDIIRNAIDVQQTFSHIFIDSGTGLSAIGLILGLEILKHNATEDCEVVVTHIAGSSSEFDTKLCSLRETLQIRFGLENLSPIKVCHIQPPTARKYGHVNASVLSYCQKIAQDFGILMDPVYSVKHYMAFNAFRNQNSPPSDRQLFIFNGSALGLMGFQETLALKLY